MLVQPDEAMYVADRPLSIAICAWRDPRHPDAGGSELYVENVARGLVLAGHRVTLLSACANGLAKNETIDGVHHWRRGNRYTVFPRAAWTLLTRQVRPDVVLDVQNGVPFLSRLVTRRPVAVLVHHVHREQWGMVFGPRLARVGWWIESRLGRRLYRRAPYLTVSESTASELVGLGVAADRIAIAHNGTPELPAARVNRSATPRIVVLGRLVPHKQVDVVIRSLPALRAQHPGVAVDVVGRGYDEERLRGIAAELGVADAVVFHGFVDEQTKSDLLAAAWINAAPSVKEGWALSVVEAARFATPSIAFADAGGLANSIVDGVTGVLVNGDEHRFGMEARRLTAMHSRHRPRRLRGRLVTADPAGVMSRTPRSVDR